MNNEQTKFIAYYRVSTDKQGERGLGMESQKNIVEQYINKVGGKLIDSYVEVASGRKINRKELTLALDACKKHKATLIVAKLDRLARNIHFISGLQRSKVKFIAADLPEANEMVIQIMAVIAEYERKLISERVKNALAVAKQRGTRLGNPNLEQYIHAPRIAQADAFAKRLMPLLKSFQDNGYSQRKIAAELTSMGVPTPAGCGRWTQPQVFNVMARLKASAGSCEKLL